MSKIQYPSKHCILNEMSQSCLEDRTQMEFSEFASNGTAEAFRAAGKLLHALETIYCRI